MMLNAGRGIEAFISALPLQAPPLCPELKLHLADDLEALWEQLQDAEATMGATPPYWAQAWPAGQALARHLLDYPSIVKGKSLLDLGAGSGICALAAAMSGATSVVACDSDPLARAAIALNAHANDLCVGTLAALGEPRGLDVIVAADIWYERFFSTAVTSWLREQAEQGARVLLCDTGRAYFPRRGVRLLARSPWAIATPDGESVRPSFFTLYLSTSASNA
jgi:predicted nicotinamide N-methyase